MTVEPSAQVAAHDWFIQSIRSFRSTMTWLEFNEQFSRFFCPASTRGNYRWQLMHLVKGDKFVEDFIREFLRLERYAPDVMQDEDMTSELLVIGLGLAYTGIKP